MRLQSTADVRSSADGGFFLSFSTEALCHLLLSAKILCEKEPPVRPLVKEMMMMMMIAFI